MNPKRPALAVVAVILLTGCGNSQTARQAAVATPSRPPPATPVTQPSSSATATTTEAMVIDGVDRADPTAVARAVVVASFTYNTATDASPNDASRRSAVWYTPTVAAELLPGGPAGPVGAEWATWTAHKATTTVTTTVNHDSGAPIDTATTAYRQLAVTITPHGANGWTVTADQYVAFVTLTRAGTGPWQVSKLQIDQ